MKFYPSLVIILVCFGLTLKAQSQERKDPPFIKYEHSAWVDSTMQSLKPDERIAQLIMVAAYSNRGKKHKNEILKLIKEQKIGGLIFFQGDPKSQIKLMNDYQQASKVPLLGAIDAEWGLGMRLDQTLSFPYQMALGAIQNNELIHQMGREVARQIKLSGLQMNFAPVIDVNNNPQNPVINYRSFGEEKRNVAQKGIAYMQGMQEENIMTTAKHFPGHGDTATDSHLALPQINHSKERLDSLEMYPFKQLINAGIGGVMVAHLDIPSLDSTGVPSTLSKPIITGILKGQLGFKGLVVTDAMNMKGVTKGNEPGVVDKKAILAGNDMLEFTEDVPKAIAEVRKAIDRGLISQEEVDARCRKLLAVKQWVGLNAYKPTPIKNIDKKLNSPQAKYLQEQLVAASLTLLNNNHGMLPIKKLDSVSIASVSIGKKKLTHFQKALSLYANISHFQLPAHANASAVKKLQQKLKKYDLVIAGWHDSSKYPRNSIKLSAPGQQFLSELATQTNTILGVFKNPYTLEKIDNIEQSPVLIEAYQDSDLTEEQVAELIFGGIGANGKLPVSVGKKYRAGHGIAVQGGLRFSYTSPEAAGMNSDILYPKIDSLMQQAINNKAIPGGVVLVAKNRKVVFYKAYGLHRYSDTVKVKKNDLYDLASITKISSALPCLMKLYDEGKFSLQAGIDNYLPYFKHSNKAGIAFRQILAHQARFKPWIAFWKNTLRNNGSYKWATFKKDSSRRFPIKVSEDMWLHRHYKRKIFRAIKKSPLEKEAKYKYSGLAFYLFPSIVEKITGEDFEKYLYTNFYRKLGATSLTYNPLDKFSKKRIVPTESDFNFRHKAIQGQVHDEGAIMMGGVSGNAGLFSNANDLAKLMQMYLDYGKYGGQRYLKEATLKEFSKTQFPDNNNRRALGFDKPNLEYKGIGNNTAKDASKTSFGHTGFTGTMVWMDPKENLLYIFLSNRVLPTRENTRLYTYNTRTQIQEVLYESLLK